MEQLLNFVLNHWIALSVSALVLWFCYAFVWKPYRELIKIGLPGPRFIPLIGSTEFFLGSGTVYLSISEMCRKYGDLFCLNAMGTSIVVVKDLDILREIMIKQFSKFNAPRTADSQIPPKSVSANLMISTSGEQWANQRHTLSPAFSASRLKHVLKLMNDSCDTLIDKKLRNVADKDEPIDIHEWMKKFTLETILSSAFGVKTETQMTEDDYLTNLSKKVMEPSTLFNVLFAVPLGQQILQLMSDPLGFGELASVAKNIVNTRTGSKKTQKDLLQLMLDSRDESKGKKLTDDEIIAQSVIFLLAGYETSSTTLGFLCHHLAVDSYIQDKIQEEIDQTLSEEEEFPSYETINKMTYLEMAVQETLRMYPPGYATERYCGEDCTINGVKFYNNTKIMIPIYAIHHDPEYYPEPEKFDPMRFSAEEKAKRDQFVYLPFGQGPRNCIGMRFALMEMKLVLVRMLKEFRLEVCSKTQIPMKPIVTTALGPQKEGVWVQVKSRKKTE